MKYAVIFKNVSTIVFLNFTILHVYNFYLQVKIFIAVIFYYIRKTPDNVLHLENVGE